MRVNLLKFVALGVLFVLVVTAGFGVSRSTFKGGKSNEIYFETKDPFQEDKIKQINEIAQRIDTARLEFKEVIKDGTDGGWLLKVGTLEGEIVKIEEDIGLSYGRVRTVMYVDNGIPIKIIETEENFERTDEGLNYSVINEVYKETIYVFDWELDKSHSVRVGQRVMSEGCSTFDYESLLDWAEKGLSKTNDIQKK